MKSFRTEIENPVVEQDIIELEKKIFQFKNNTIDEEKFRSLRLARGVYGQRQQGVQMVRIKIPYGKFSATQLRRIASVSDKYSNGNLHITTRQDIQIHYVDLDRTPELWAELEQDQITMREACGNTVRNVTASIYAGIDKEEPFDVTPYAHAFHEYFLRNPICQDMGRKFKVAFSSSSKDHALTFVHDLGFIPKIKNEQHGFKVLVGGGIGSQPKAADILHDFLPADQLIPLSEAVIRVFDRYGERNRRNKARLKFLIKEMGYDVFVKHVENTLNELPHSTYPIEYHQHKTEITDAFSAKQPIQSTAIDLWSKTNVIAQKQEGLVSVGLCIQTGDISSNTARSLAEVMEHFCGEEARFTPNQGILLRSVRKDNLAALYEALDAIGLSRPGFERINDIVACPGTDTCNLGIASSMGLANKLQEVIENEYASVIEAYQISIKISGCMNACGQHTIADIGFQGMTLKSNGKIAPATQILLGGGVLSDGEGLFANKVLKVPSKRTPDVLRWLLDDFQNNHELNENFRAYYHRKEADYFYQNLKHYSDATTLIESDFIDWGNENQYEKAIGIGECAGVAIDLVQTLLFDAEEHLEKAIVNYDNQHWSNSIYYAYAAQIRAAKALLTTAQAKINSHQSIISSFDTHFSDYTSIFGASFADTVQAINEHSPDQEFAEKYLAQAKQVYSWIKSKSHA
jgi:sulfite reductase (ferredoxin)